MRTSWVELDRGPDVDLVVTAHEEAALRGVNAVAGEGVNFDLLFSDPLSLEETGQVKMEETYHLREGGAGGKTASVTERTRVI